MKGRPPGTPKSDDPNKKKRKRTARQRDLCDVKIKITEYFPGAQLQLDDASSGSPLAQNIVGAGQRLWTIQRVNGNGGNGKGDGVAGPHKHTLARSDEIKKNSIQRYLAKQEKETKKTQVGHFQCRAKMDRLLISGAETNSEKSDGRSARHCEEARQRQ